MATFIMGDVHGYYSQLINLLLKAKLIDKSLTWRGGTSTLCLVGDYVNRGPDSITVIDFLISLQIQAEAFGGRVVALMGNHEPILVAAHRFRTRINRHLDISFLDAVEGKYGTDDVHHLTPEHIAWLTHLPAMVMLENRLILHADASFYLTYGKTIDEMNARFEAIMRSYSPDEWADWLRDFSEHRAFWKDGGQALAERFLRQFGGVQIIHGHSAIGSTIKKPAEQVKEPLVYANNLVINVDGGITHGGEGFIYKVE